MSTTSERYEVEVLTAEDGETRWDYSDLDEAAIMFYQEVAAAYREPSTEVALHDLVQGKTIALFVYVPNDDLGRVQYDNLNK